jgi:low temperature requirement protein LtrA
MTSGGPGILRAPEDPRRVSALELFFDLAFLLALSRLSRLMDANLDWSGAAHTLLLLALIWRVWLATTWSTDWYDPATRVVQALIGSAMFGSLLMAVAVPKAFGAYALVFAVAYVAVHLLRGAVLRFALRAPQIRARSERVAAWYLLSGAFLVAGAVARRFQVPLWAAALALDYLSFRLGWPTPGLGRTTERQLRARGSRLWERYQQVFIISVGELILLAGAQFSQAGLTWPRSIAFALTFLHAALLALIYYAPAGRRLAEAIDEAEHPAYVGQDSALLHLVLIAGVLVSTVGDGRLITEVNRPASTPVVVATLAGTALFLVGRALLFLLANRRVLGSWLFGPASLAAIAGLAPVAFRLPPWAIVAVCDAILLAITVAAFAVGRPARRPERLPQ